jgi:hypothetical protein
MSDTMTVIGRKADGAEVNLGEMPISLELKARELLRSYGFPNYDDEDSLDACALWAMQDLVALMRERVNKQQPIDLSEKAEMAIYDVLRNIHNGPMGGFPSLGHVHDVLDALVAAGYVVHDPSKVL